MLYALRASALLLGLRRNVINVRDAHNPGVSHQSRGCFILS